jgi:hypothetical protein
MLFFVGCKSNGTQSENAQQAQNIEQGTENQQLCFLAVTENEPFISDGKKIQYNDSIYVYLTIDSENNVTGQYDWLPAERDSRRGEVRGKLVDGKIDAVCTFYAEGEEYEEPVTFEISDTEVIVKEGGEVINTLPKVDCQ